MPTLRNIQKRNKENIHKTMDLSFNFIRPDFETKFKKNYYKSIQFINVYVIE